VKINPTVATARDSAPNSHWENHLRELAEANQNCAMWVRDVFRRMEGLEKEDVLQWTEYDL
jgi:hypothetical protein